MLKEACQFPYYMICHSLVFLAFYVNSAESKHEADTCCMTFLNATYVFSLVALSLCLMVFAPTFDFLSLDSQIRTVSYAGRTKGFVLFFLLLLVA
jgi:hypothetical protein